MNNKRDIVFGLRLSKAENKALNILSRFDGTGKSSLARKALRAYFRDNAQAIPAELLALLNLLPSGSDTVIHGDTGRTT